VRSKLSVTCRGFRPLCRNTLRGFAEIRIDELRLTIRDVAVHAKGSARWVQLPAKPMIDRDGNVLRDRESGKITYATILDFDSRAVREAFSHAVIDAVLRTVPGALEIEEEVS
jgi:hypothetical protein